MNEILLQQAEELAKAGRKTEARALLQQILREDPFNESAWIWYADCAATPEIRFQALETCTRLNPSAQKAREALGVLRRPPEPWSPKVWDAQPVWSQTPAFIPLTGKAAGEPMDAMKLVERDVTGIEAGAASREEDWVLSTGAAIFTVSPDLITPEEFAQVEARAETFLLARMEAPEEPAAQRNAWEALGRPVELNPAESVGLVTRKAAHNRASARKANRRVQKTVSAAVTTLVMAIMFALLIGAFLVIRGA